jgi:hypothetical protein
MNLPFRVKPFGDQIFFTEAKTISEYLRGIDHQGKEMFSNAPGPTLFYSIPLLFSPLRAESKLLANYIFIFTSLFSAFSFIILYRATKLIFNFDTAILSSILFFIFPLHVYYTLGITGEAPAFFGSSLMLLGWAKILRKANTRIGIMFFVLGDIIAILNRPNSILFLGIGIIVLITLILQKSNTNKYLIKPLIFCLLSTGCLGFCLLKVFNYINLTYGNKNDNKQRNLVYVAHQGRFQFRHEPFNFNYWDGDMRAGQQDYEDWNKSADSLEVVYKSTNSTYLDEYEKFLIEDLKSNPLLYLRQFFIKAIYGHIFMINSIKSNRFKIGPLKGNFGYIIFIICINIINIFILTGFFIYLSRGHNLLETWPLWGMLLALLLFHCLTYMEPRYMLPSKPGLFIASAFGLLQIPIIKKIITAISQKLMPAQKESTNGILHKY